jgi:DNA damage-binding protein 1
VACLDVTPLQEGSGKAEIVAVGLWTDISARILRLPGLEEVNREFLGGGEIQQSVPVKLQLDNRFTQLAPLSP